MKRKEALAKKACEQKPAAFQMIAYTSFIDGYNAAVKDAADYIEARNWHGQAGYIRNRLGNDEEKK